MVEVLAFPLKHVLLLNHVHTSLVRFSIFSFALNLPGNC